MENFRTIAKFLIFFFFIFSLSLSAVGNGGKEEKVEKQGPSIVERATGLTTPISPWNKIKSLINVALMNFRPPDSANDQASSSAGEAMKEAVSKSFQTSKTAAENIAKSAAEVTGETVHNTLEKLKRTVSSPGTESEPEL
ncbi:uncharacterized protein LOC143848760 [Tasmannia lanceolata]|uniref:uncharacterized protein LOC143848760 n=1 Tax=Tasmannia lanceolata TaxID=3420 RepID=UPI0040642685